MTIDEAIREVDGLNPNSVRPADKRRWLRRLDQTLKVEVMDEYYGDVQMPQYDEKTPGDTVLLAPAPYDEMYPLYLQAQIEAQIGAYERYNNTIERFNAVMERFKAWYNRTHTHRAAAARWW